jgi:hypothetical protein
MSTIQWSHAALLADLQAIAAAYLGLGQATFRLAQADFTFDPALSAGQFVEADFPGYTSLDVDDADWNTPFINGSGQAEIDGVPLVWTCSGTPSGGMQNIYGWWLQDASSGDVVWCEHFDAPVSLTANGQTVTRDPTLIVGQGP